MFWVVLTFYLAIVGLGAYFFWTSYRIGKKRIYTLIRDNDGTPLPLPHLAARQFTILAACCGVGVVLFLLAIPLFHIQWTSWHFAVAFIGFCAAIARQILIARHKRLLAATHGERDTTR